MADINLFEIAAKEKYRFDRNNWISVEELWGMTFTELDNVYKYLMELKIKRDSIGSLIKPEKIDESIDNRIAIVTYIFEEKKKGAKNDFNKRQIIEAIERKREKELSNLSEKELKDMLEECE